MAKFKKDDVVGDGNGTVLWMLSGDTFKYPSMGGWTRHKIAPESLAEFEEKFSLHGNLNDPAYINKLINPARNAKTGQCKNGHKWPIGEQSVVGNA